MNLGVNADAVTSYVAMSRFKTASDLIIVLDLSTDVSAGGAWAADSSSEVPFPREQR